MLFNNMYFTKKETTILFGYFCDNGVFGTDAHQSALVQEEEDFEEFESIFNKLKKSNTSQYAINFSNMDVKLLRDYLGSNGFLAKEPADIDDDDRSDPHYNDIITLYDKICSFNMCKHAMNCIFDMSIDPYYENNKNLTHGYHYSQCIYCIMEGTNWHEEYDSWQEVTTRAIDIIKFGFYDYKRGLTGFLETFTLPTKCNDKECICKKRKGECIDVTSRIKPFIKFYKMGLQMGAMCDTFPNVFL